MRSIYFYLLDPDGTFVDAFGKATTAEEVVEKVGCLSPFSFSSLAR